ncbi:DedA family protein, partial [Escherichia coli]|uniref:DedA family protein n=1 Tax=Escherichia coli TaxID=562 RepID=UPI00390C9D86
GRDDRAFPTPSTELGCAFISLRCPDDAPTIPAGLRLFRPFSRYIFEGETILVLAGFLAFRGYMQLDTVILTAFLGSYAGDQLWYFLGRRH